MNSRASVNLHIEELMLHGFASGDRHHIREAVQQELARLFAEQPLPTGLAKPAESGAVDGGAFRVANGAKPAVIGTQIAAAIHGGLKL